MLEFFQYLTGGALLVGITAYLSKLMVQHWFAKHLESCKSDLKCASRSRTRTPAQ